MAVLAVYGWRVFVAVRALGRELRRTTGLLRSQQTASRDELGTLRAAAERRTARDGVRSS
jgi:hypothetical protein